MNEKWRSKIEALLQLTEDRGATPAEAKLAKEKLRELIDKYPQAYLENQERVDNVLYGRDFLELKRAGDTHGSWTSNTLEGALEMMVKDYQDRLRKLRMPKLESGNNG